MKIEKTRILTLRSFTEIVLENIENGGTLSDDAIAILARQALGIDSEDRMLNDPYQALMNLYEALPNATISGALDVIQMETQEPHTITDFCDAVIVTLRDRLT